MCKLNYIEKKDINRSIILFIKKAIIHLALCYFLFFFFFFAIYFTFEHFTFNDFIPSAVEIKKENKRDGVSVIIGKCFLKECSFRIGLI